MNKFNTLYLSLLCTLLLAAGCTDNGCTLDVDAPVALQPSFATVSGTPLTRSIVSNIGAGEGEVNRIGVYLTLPDGHTNYAHPAISSAIYTFNSSTWTPSRPVNLRTAQARLYAWYPPAATPDTEENGSTRTVPVSVPASQTFDGGYTTACSQTDYLYGSASSNSGDATGITVDRNNSNPTIYLQHALAQLIFTIDYKSGRVPDADYDWVKSISLTTGSSSTTIFRAADSGTMALHDGTLTLVPAATLTFTAIAATSRLPGAIGAPQAVAYGLVAPKGATTTPVTLNLVLGQKGVTTNDRTLTATTTLFDKAWEKGKCYTYHLSLDKNDLTLKTVSIKGWSNASDSGEMPPVIE